MSEDSFIRISSESPEPGRIREVAEHLRADGLLAYPTETVYGFGCLLRPQPLRMLFRLKRGDVPRPLLLLIGGRADVGSLRWTEGAEALARAFWPGPLTLVLPDPEARFPAEVRNARGGVAVRETPHPVMRALLEVLGEPITSTSANVPGKPPSLSAEDARDAGLELLKARELEASLRVVDGGRLPPSESSTLVDFTGSKARLLRPGVIPLDALKSVLDEIDESETRE